MIAVLALVVSIAGITLIAFGERLGFVAGIAGSAIPIILGLFVIVIALVSVTSRLTIYLDASEGKSALKAVATQLVLVLAGLSLMPDLTIADPRSGLVMLAAYLTTLVFVPSREPMSLLPDAERRMSGIDRTRMIGFVTIGFSMLFFAIWFKPVLVWLAKTSGVAQSEIRHPMLAVLAIVVLFGGLSAISRLAEGALAFALLFAGLPLAFALGGEALRSIDPAVSYGLQWPVHDLASAFIGLASGSKTILPLLTGIGLGLMTLASTPALGGPGRRGGFGLVIVGLAALVAYGFAREAASLPALVMRDLVPVAPQNWPLFVFDEAIRGWLLVCQEAPRDAIDVIQACRRSGVSGAIPPEMFDIRPDMIGPALAAARGMPAAFGLVSGLLGPFMAFIALALLLQIAAASFAETILYRLLAPRALRAIRLARMRLVVLAVLALLVFAPAFPAQPDPKFVLWLGLSFIMLLVVTLIAEWTLVLLRRIDRWRARPYNRDATLHTGPVVENS
ncbi:MAG: hypothetical protein ACRDBL_14945 [Rhabdaerophilum sp.]